MTGSPFLVGSAISSRHASHPQAAILDPADPLDPRAQRGVDQALRLALGALRVPLALVALHDSDRTVRLIRLAESGVWESIEDTPVAQSLAGQVVSAVNASNAASRGAVRGRISVGQLGVVEYSALPIQVGEERVGAFAVVDRRQREWGSEHLSMMRDITGVIAGEVEWHRARSAAAETGGADHLIAALLEVSGEGIVVFDTDRRCRIWNPFMERLTERSAAESIGRAATDLEVVLRMPDLDLLITRALMGESTTAADQLYRPGSPDSDPQYVAVRVAPLKPANGPITGVVVVVSDTTTAMTAERRRQRGEELFRRLIEHSTELLTVMAPDGTVLFDSLSNERIAGYEPDELLGRRLFDLVHPDDRSRVAAAIDRIGAGEQGTITVEYRYRHKNGSWLRLLSVCRNLSEDPFVRGIVLNSRDITEWRAMEEQLHEARKMDALGRLAGGIAHDFNNLLTAIKGNVQLLLMDAPTGAPGREELEEIDQVSDRAAQLTRRLLAFSRRKAPTPATVDVSEVVRGTTRMLQRLVGDVRLAVSVRECSFVHADATQLEQVLLNLVINARDAMPNGGTVEVTVDSSELPPELALSPPDPGRRPFVRISVSDTGEGMDPLTQAQIFEPFFTTKESGQGTGLGLATVYAIVRQSSGQITVHSAPGQGTRFDIYLPAVSPAAEQPLARARA
jgi:PAS domain S-box-containing protein